MNFRKLFFISAVSLLAANVFCSDGYMEIEALEAKKSELVSVRDGNPAEENEILANAKREYESAASQIDAQLVRIAEADANGNLLAEVKQRRAEEKAAIKAEIDQRASNEIAALKNGDTAYENELYSGIQQMENDLKVTRIIDSYEYPDLLTIKSYAGDKYYWNTTVKFVLGSNTIFTQNVPLYYEKVSGKAAVKLSKADEATYNEYLDTVDFYDDDMRYNNGTVVLEIEYVISACDKSQPSTYTIQIKGMRFVNKATNTLIQQVTPAATTYTLKMSPAIDVRTESEKKGYTSTGNKTVSGSSTSVSSVTAGDTATSSTGNKTVSGTTTTTTTTTTTAPSYVPSKQTLLNSVDQERFLVGCTYGVLPVYSNYDLNEFCMTASAFFTLPVYSNLFFQMDMGLMPTPSYFGEYKNPTETLFNAMLGVGLNYRLGLGSYHPNFYVSGSCGVGASAKLTYKNSYSSDEALLLLGRFSTGVDFPIGSLLVVTTDYSLWFVEEAGVASNFSVGLSIDLN